MCVLRTEFWVLMGNIVVTLRPVAHFRPLCSWNATFCYIILSEAKAHRVHFGAK